LNLQSSVPYARARGGNKADYQKRRFLSVQQMTYFY
jgi:hypothetical protein